MLSHTKHDVHPVIATEGYTIAENRAYCLNRAIENRCSHILFIDDDMTFPEDTIEKLLAVDKPIVGVNSMSRKLPLQPTTGLIGPNGEYVKPELNDIPSLPFRCHSVGFGVCLIDMAVIAQMKPPHFGFESLPNGMTTMGEDGWFCKKARDLLIEIWCDPRLVIGHIGEYNYGGIF